MLDIAEGTTGFEPRLSGTNVGQIWGVGSYFARDAIFSADYALRGSFEGTDNCTQFFLVDVVVGRWERGAKGKKFFSKVPGIDPPQPVIKIKLFVDPQK